MTDKQKLIILLDDFELGYTDENNNIVLKEGNENVIGRGGYGATFIFEKDNSFDALKIHKE
ncbi:hypothetical protein [Clostridium estertheticum]|uniref:Uncharacterized protein n=1 Tax=Clostridium estertheticum TaxID=238834 RepID=A0A5N7IVW4_9CLOT|nr:hypothetical protein [Clostridium estertheticum]MBU3074679.1 hypothetical protein [Clostridium estertheticum]MBU3164609.1 hypothetical protein [Clostridium estertheticum]MBU3185531.1 hypothetical protein [Clostridium estertheticum]MBX4261636.1 hypothetical protein [Clostridium estertheticum]MBX4266110.1 hypothetical protein [Clostridium estertheticum]